MKMHRYIPVLQSTSKNLSTLKTSPYIFAPHVQSHSLRVPPWPSPPECRELIYLPITIWRCCCFSRGTLPKRDLSINTRSSAVSLQVTEAINLTMTMTMILLFNIIAHRLNRYMYRQ